MSDLRQHLYWIHGGRLLSARKSVASKGSKYQQKQPEGSGVSPGDLVLISMHVPDMPQDESWSLIRAYQKNGVWMWDRNDVRGWVVSQVVPITAFDPQTRLVLGMTEGSSLVLKMELLTATNIIVKIVSERRRREVSPFQDVEVYYARPSIIPRRQEP